MKRNVMLSVVIISYNQEKYIKDAIESVINQKTNYEYEILLADDCSPDNTGKIMKEYAEKYPKLIKIIERKKNLGGTQNQLDACQKATGKYITVLEGDDYWNNDRKIQEQIDFLEKNPEFIGVSHLQEGRSLNNEFMGLFPSSIDEDFIINDLNELLKGKKYSETSTIYRNIYNNEENVESIKQLLSIDQTIADAQLCSYLVSLGKIYVIAKPMMVYRIRNNDGESNYNSTHKVNEIELSYLKIDKELDKFFKYKYSFFNKYRNCFTVGVTYDIITGNFKDIKNFFIECPKRYLVQIILLFPFTCLQELIKRLKRKKRKLEAKL